VNLLEKIKIIKLCKKNVKINLPLINSAMPNELLGKEKRYPQKQPHGF
jgi:hypothetical protein